MNCLSCTLRTGPGSCRNLSVKQALAAVIIIASLTVPARSVNSQSPEELLGEARDLCRRQLCDSAIVIGQRALDAVGPPGPVQDTMAARILHHLGDFHNLAGHYAPAESLYIRSLRITERIFSLENEHAANTLNNLGSLYRQTGRYAEAVELLKRAIAIWKRQPDAKKLAIATGTANLGTAYRAQGFYTEAEACFNRALAVLEDLFDADDQRLSIILNNMANLYAETGRYEEAHPYFQRAIGILSKHLESDHPDLALTQTNLAVTLYEQDSYEEAESLLVAAIDAQERTLGDLHPRLASSLNDLATLYLSQDRYDEAEPLLNRAISINRQTLPEIHPEVANSIHGLAMLSSLRGEYQLSLEHFREFLGLRQRFMFNMFSYSSEAQKLRWVRKHPLIDNALLTIALQTQDSVAVRLAFEMVLHGKSAVVDAVMAEREVGYCSDNDSLTARYNQFADLSSMIARMALADLNQEDFDQFRDSLEHLMTRRDSLEAELSRQCAVFDNRVASSRFDLSDLAAALPEKAVLWEYLKFEPYVFSMSGNIERRDGPARYVAFVLGKHRGLALVDLGPAEPIDSLIDTVRQMIYADAADLYSPRAAEAEEDFKMVSAGLYRTLFEPLVSQSSTDEIICVSPDGQLNLLPLEILPQSDGSYVIEKYRICYLSSGQDLIRSQRNANETDGVLILADPDYEAGLNDSGTDTVPGSHPMKTALFNPPVRRAGLDCISNGFTRLRSGIAEAESVARLFKAAGFSGIQKLIGVDASEERVKRRSTPPHTLHLATHGFFCDNDHATDASNLVNPLLQCGLALAGGNRQVEHKDVDWMAGDDGILTAFEISGLNLFGTKLVMLSACESGLGRIVKGEGVFGLRRAFQVAGAESIVSSLWKVPDRVSSDLVSGFYERWLGGTAMMDALRQSSLRLLDRSRDQRGHAHPLLWAGFVITGAP